MKGVEKIFSKKKLIAVVYRKNIHVEGVKFLTEESNPFQIGLHSQEKGVKLTPHMHKLEKDLTITKIQEILFLVGGKIRVNLFDKNGHKITRKILTSGDSILLMDEGHGVDFLENSRIFEIKQGPYPGATNAKIFLKGKNGDTSK